MAVIQCFYTELVLVWGKTVMGRTRDFEFGRIRSHGHASSEHTSTAYSKLLSWLAYRSMRTESTADSALPPLPVVRKLNHSNSILAPLCLCFRRHVQLTRFALMYRTAFWTQLWTLVRSFLLLNMQQICHVWKGKIKNFVCALPTLLGTRIFYLLYKVFSSK